MLKLSAQLAGLSSFTAMKGLTILLHFCIYPDIMQILSESRENVLIHIYSVTCFNYDIFVALALETRRSVEKMEMLFYI